MSSPREPLALRLIPAPLLARAGGDQPRQVIAEVSLPAPGDAALDLQLAGQQIHHPLGRLAAGTSRHLLALPEPASPTPLAATLRTQAGEARAETTLAPARRWTIFLVHHSHFDIGYTDLQPTVLQQQQEFLDLVLAYCRDTADWPEGARFAWTVEATMPLQLYLANRPPERVAAFMELVRAGRVEVAAIYANLTSEQCSAEGLVRSLAFAGELREHFGITVDSAMQTDLTGLTWGFIPILAGAGVRYLALAPNNYHARFDAEGGGSLPRPFWWAAPDGSRVLTWITDQPYIHYQEGNFLGFVEDVDAVLERLPDYLLRREAAGYPWDVLHLRVQGWPFGDNLPPSLLPATIARAWNQRWEWPRLRVATNREFFQYMEERHGDAIPTLAGDLPTWWADGAGSAAYELGLNRLTHTRLIAAEAIGALDAAARGNLGAAPRERIAAANQEMLLFDEHTWGATWPEQDASRGGAAGARQWRWKAAYAERAAAQSEALLQAALHSLAGRIGGPPGPRLAVVNPLSWTRTDRVEAPLPMGWTGGTACTVVDEATGERAPGQITPHTAFGGGRVRFLAREVPGLGYRTYRLEAAPPAEPAAAGSPGLAEGRFYRVELDPASGAVRSLIDRDLGRELVDGAAPFGLNAPVYEEYERPAGQGRAYLAALAILANRFYVDLSAYPWDDLVQRLARRYQPEETEVSAPARAADGVLELRARTRAGRCREVELRILVDEELKRIDFVDRVQKEATLAKESLAFPFPFALPEAEIHHEIAAGIVRPGRDELPGGCREWYAIQSWVHLASRGVGVTWAPLEAPLVQYGGIRTAQPAGAPWPRNGWVVSWAMNNLWSTNFPAAQGGEASFRYRLTSDARPYDPLAATRFGWEAASPLLAVPLAGDAPAPRLAPGTGALLRVEPAGLLVQAVKRAERGDDLVVRLYQPRGEGGTARLQIAGVVLAGAALADLVERPREPLTVREGEVEIPYGGHSLTTVRLRLARV